VVRISVCVLDIPSEVDHLLSRAGRYGVRAFVMPMPSQSIIYQHLVIYRCIGVATESVIE